MPVGPLLLSLFVAAMATALVVLTGLPIAYWLSQRRGRGARLVESLVTAPLVIPPVVTGYYLLLLFGPRGPLGRLLEDTVGVSVVFHWSGAVLASALVALPLLVRTARSCAL